MRESAIFWKSDIGYERMYNRNIPHMVIGIGNSYEFHHRLFLRENSGISLPPRKSSYAASAEMALFWGGNKCIVLTPEMVDPVFLEDVSNILKLDVQNVLPNQSTGFICDDFSVKELEGIFSASKDNSFTILPYGVTLQFYDMLEKLATLGLSPAIQTYPLLEDFWTIDFIDSKAGGRSILCHIAEEISFFSVPFAILAENQEQTMRVAQALMKRNKQFVVKSNHGHGGRQVFNFDSDRRDEQEALFTNLRTAFSSDPYFGFSPFILEDSISNDGCYPVNVNGQITQFGELLYEGPSMLMTSHAKQYIGAQIGYGVFTKNLLEMLETVGLAVGRKLAALGYVGWYDVDMIYDAKSNHLFGIEINPRSTGITYAMGIAKLLFGDNWQHSGALISVDRFFLNRPVPNYSVVRPLVAKINNIHAATNGGVVPTVTRALSLETPYLGYAAFASDIEMARAIRNQFESQLQNEL